jgi:hypothetical protein
MRDHPSIALSALPEGDAQVERVSPATLRMIFSKSSSNSSQQGSCCRAGLNSRSLRYGLWLTDDLLSFCYITSRLIPSRWLLFLAAPKLQREANEELGIDPSKVKVLATLQPLLSKHMLSVTPVVAVVPAERTLHAPSPNVEEVEKVGQHGVSSEEPCSIT